jgi:hypothetical protein
MSFSTVPLTKTVAIAFSGALNGQPILFESKINLLFQADAVKVKQIYYTNRDDNTCYQIRSNIAPDQSFGLVVDAKEALIANPDLTIRLNNLSSGTYNFTLLKVSGAVETVDVVASFVMILEFIKLSP